MLKILDLLHCFIKFVFQHVATSPPQVLIYTFIFYFEQIIILDAFKNDNVNSRSFFRAEIQRIRLQRKR